MSAGTSSTNALLDKIQKMLAKAEQYDEKGNRTPEAETALKIAQRVMAENALSMEQIERHGVTGTNVEYKGGELGVSEWRKFLLSVVSKHSGCTSFWRGNTGYFFGRESDCQIASYLFEICERQIEKGGQKYHQELEAQGHDVTSRRTLSNDFRYWAVQGLGEKLEQMRKEEMDPEVVRGNALVHSRADSARENLLQTHKIKVRAWKGRQVNEDGYSHGKKMQLHRALGGSSGSNGKPTELGFSYKDVILAKALEEPAGIPTLARSVGCSLLTARKHVLRLHMEGKLGGWRGTRGNVFGDHEARPAGAADAIIIDTDSE